MTDHSVSPDLLLREEAVATALKVRDAALAWNREHGFPMFDEDAMAGAFIGALEAQDPPFTVAALQASPAPEGPNEDEVAALVRSGALIPVAVFGADECDHPGCEDPNHRGYGLMDRFSRWSPAGSDCNRAVEMIFRPNDLQVAGAPQPDLDAVRAAVTAVLDDDLPLHDPVKLAAPPSEAPLDTDRLDAPNRVVRALDAAQATQRAFAAAVDELDEVVREYARLQSKEPTE